MTAETIDNTVVITGDVTVQEAERFPTWKKNGDYYETVDLSQATFSEYEYTCQRGTRLGHSGLTAHGRGTATKRVDTFLTLLDRLHAGTVILPSGVTRKQMNACIKSGTIGRIIVTDDSRLFSMKDGDIWNKKGTLLVHKQDGAPAFVTCEGCRRSFIASAAGKTVDGGLVCPDCQSHSGHIIGTSGRYFPFNGIFYKMGDARLAEQLAEAGTDMESYLWKLRVARKS